MEQKQFNISWQGIGIPSNPYQKENPLSAHLLAHLQEASETTDKHVIVVADNMQISNYMALYGLNKEKAKKLALKKGGKKANGLEKICRANHLNNIKIKRFNDIWKKEQETIYGQIVNTYQNDSEIKQLVDSVIPKRLRKKTNSDLISNYALKEIALILSLPGVKFGHEKEKGYDEIAKLLHEKHRIGNKPEFCYSKLGLEFIPNKGFKIEPYSSLVSDSRILLTDSKKVFLKKVKNLSSKTYEKLKNYVKEIWDIGNGEFTNEFYDKVIKPTRKVFVRPKKIALTAVSIALISGLSGSAYVNAEANKIRQKYINEIPGFVFSGDPERCRKALGDKIDSANQEIQSKFFVKNYHKK